MIKPVSAENEPAKTQALSGYALSDTLPEKDFDDLTMLASQICETPISTIDILHSNKQFLKSYHGPDSIKKIYDFSFSAHALNTSKKNLIITDATKDKRFLSALFVTGKPHFIFYAGIPLINSDGSVLGILSVIDHMPRRLSKHQLSALKALSNQAIKLFELKRKTTLFDEKQSELHSTLDLFEQTSKVSKIGGWNVDLINNKTTFTSVAREIHEIGEDFILNIETGINFYKPGENRNRITAIVEQALQQETSYNVELQIITAKGNERWIRTKGTSIFENGRCIRLFGTIQNITAKKLKDIQLAQSEKLFRQTLDYAPSGIALVSIEGKWIKVNKSLCDMVGYTEDELLQIDFQKITHPDDLAIDMQRVQAVLNKDIQSYQLEKRYIHKNGSIVWVLLSVSLVIDEEGKPLHLISHIIDITRRVKNRQKRKEEREFLNTLIDNIPVNIFIKDLQSKKTLVNKKEVEYLGYNNAEQVLGKDDFELYTSESATVSREEDVRVFNTGVPMLNVETMNTKPDGSKHWFLTSKIPLKNADEKITGLLGISYGIDERKLAEESLKQAEQKWKFALEGSGDVMWEYNLEDDKLSYSDQYKKMLGYKDDKEYKNILEHWKEQMHPEDLIKIQGTSNKYKNKIITTHHFEYRIKNKKGNYIWLLNRGMLIEKTGEGKPKKVIGTITNIDAQKKLELEFKSSANRLYNLISNMQDGIMVADEKRNIVLVNKMFCDMFDISASPEKLTGFPCVLMNEQNKILFKAPNKFINDTDEIFKKRQPHVESVLELTDGRIFRREYVPLFFDDKYAGYFWKYSDITLQQVLEQQLRESKQEAEQSSRAKEMFLANMSHEIRTPMNAILGMGRQLQKTSVDKKQQFYLDAINNATANLLVLINDILDFSKIEAGQLKLENIGFDLGDIIHKAVHMMSHKADEKSNIIIVQVDEMLSPVLIGDPFRINQVLLNLLSNALKFTDKGNVTVNCNVMRDAVNEQFVCIEVNDTGAGMSKKFISNLYTEFVQEDESVGRNYGGTGLGMSIIKQLVELMKGQVYVESEKGKGTQVKIFLPFTKGNENDLPKKASRITESDIFHNKHILLVEDNEMNRMVATAVLNEYGATTAEAANGKEAVAMLRHNNYDLILMDMRMPVMDGIEATKIIRNEISKTIPIIALTANSFSGEQAKCMQSGMNDFVYKPFEEDELVQKIIKWLEIDAAITVATKEIKIEEEKLFDLSKVEKISRGNKDFIQKMLQIFTRETIQSLQEIKTARQENDFKKINDIAHKMKASVSNMAINSIKDDVLQLEAFDITKTDAAQLNKLINKIDLVLSQVIEQIKHNEAENLYAR